MSWCGFGWTPDRNSSWWQQGRIRGCRADWILGRPKFSIYCTSSISMKSITPTSSPSVGISQVPRVRTGDFEEWLRLQRETAARSIGTARPSAQDQMIEETLRPNEPGMEYFMGWPRHSGNVAISPRYVSICGRPTRVGKLGARVPQGKGRASGKTKAEGGQVMPELGKGTSRIHTPAPQLGSLSGRRSSHLRPPWRPVARDLLPLPLPEVMQISDDARLLSRPVRQRLLRRRAMDLRVAETVQALNFLDGHTWDPNCRPSHRLRSPTGLPSSVATFCQQAHVNIPTANRSGTPSPSFRQDTSDRDCPVIACTRYGDPSWASVYISFDSTGSTEWHVTTWLTESLSTQQW